MTKYPRHFTTEEYKMNQQSKKVLIRKWLESGKAITPKEAYSMFGSMRLAAIIHDLKQDGFKFETEIIKNGRSKYARYRLDLPTTLFPN
jgi:hypothetical protein